MTRRAGHRAAILIASWLVAACYPGMQNTHGAVNSLTMGDRGCSGITLHSWSFPHHSDHCFAFKRGEGKSLRVQLRTRADDFDAVVTLWRRAEADQMQAVARNRVQGSGTTAAFEVELPGALDNVYAVEVTEVSGGSYSIKLN